MFDPSYAQPLTGWNSWLRRASTLDAPSQYLKKSLAASVARYDMKNQNLASGLSLLAPEFASLVAINTSLVSSGY